MKASKSFPAAIIGLCVSSYTLGVVLGYIPVNQRIDLVNLLVIILAILWITNLIHPTFFKRLKAFEVQGFKLEMIEVKERQKSQESQLEAINLILPLLLPANERKHLVNLDSQVTADYKGSHTLRSEIRRLRSIGLVKMKNGKHVSDMKDGTNFNLEDYIESTDVGKRWVALLTEIEKGIP